MARVVLFPLLAALLVIGACAPEEEQKEDSNGNTGGGVSDPSGLWYGTVEGISGDPGLLSVAIEGSSVTVTVSAGATGNPPSKTLGGSITHKQGDIYGIELSDGTVGNFMTDDAGTHAGFVAENFSYFGVVEKGASGLDTESSNNFVFQDIIASWSGSTVELTSDDTGISEVYASSVAVGDVGGYSGSDKYVDLSGTLLSHDGTYGRYTGSGDHGATAILISGLLTEDKGFFAGHMCPGDLSLPRECWFTLWSKQ